MDRYYYIVDFIRSIDTSADKLVQRPVNPIPRASIHRGFRRSWSDRIEDAKPHHRSTVTTIVKYYYCPINNLAPNTQTEYQARKASVEVVSCHMLPFSIFASKLEICDIIYMSA
ncbi:hypothetical protein DTO164E3_1869 [Paecilomyces variotii]|nr:hypothetical protein DTO164E3_1869 [Paecilomyces variotii]KAJ9208537.1 hypothetical protein DTO032I3_514 [Paecilomyces variotii]KAJ9282380.1 hypothetical protein DTO021D3_528 [Paecilomyces variotii]KAJ9344106.1 hypothetical protein DTO027B6_3143 [Paecilomyces variotii]KAJ9389724.1 hypothetical protein DTO032I4_2081 [Paecilomyces variotii]